VEGRPVGREEEGNATGAHNLLKYLLAPSEFYAPVTYSEMQDEVSKYWASPFKIQLPRRPGFLYLCTPAIERSILVGGIKKDVIKKGS
jgi:hypothetical protein